MGDKNLFISVCLVLLSLIVRGLMTDEYDGTAYYYYEEEGPEEYSDLITEEIIDEDQLHSFASSMNAEAHSKYGYYRQEGERLPISPLLTPEYLNITLHEYQCVLQNDYYVKKYQLTEEELEELRLGQEGPQATRESWEDVVSRMRTRRTSQEVEEARLQELEERQRLEEIEELALLTKSNGAATNKRRDKKFTFREIELLRIERKKTEIDKSKRHQKLFNLGPSCERLVCNSCRLTVREFGLAVFAAVRDPRFTHIADIAAESFCDRDQIYRQYHLQVYDVCNLVMNNPAYRQQLVISFDQEYVKAVEASRNQHTLSGYDPSRRRLYWDFVMDAQEEYLYLRQEQVCVGIGACQRSVDFDIGGAVVSPPLPPEPDEYDEPLEPQDPSIKQREHAIKNETCAVCHAVFLSMETRAWLERTITEKTVDAIVTSTCDRIGLFSRVAGENNTQRLICEAIALGKHRTSIGWMLKMHIESIKRKVRVDELFADQACEELQFCTRWVDAAEVKRAVERSVNAEYS